MTDAEAPQFDEHWLTGPSETKFYVRTYSPQDKPKAIVVFCHGFIEHIARYSHVFPMWTSRGFAVFTYDQRGFGRTALDTANKSSDSSYAKTSDADQMADAEWAIKTAHSHFKGQELGIPIYLMGHSMGGGIVLSFVTRKAAPPSSDAISLLSGVIATSPLIRQATPASKIQRWLGGKAANFLPYQTIPVPLAPNDMSRDKEVAKAYAVDPYVKLQGTLRGISDMLDRGDALLATQHKHWPPELPLLICHGTSDRVTSRECSEIFIDKIPATDKTLTLFPGCYHELHNEPDGVKERCIDTCITWVEKRLESDNQNSAKL